MSDQCTIARTLRLAWGADTLLANVIPESKVYEEDLAYSIDELPYAVITHTGSLGANRDEMGELDTSNYQIWCYVIDKDDQLEIKNQSRLVFNRMKFTTDEGIVRSCRITGIQTERGEAGTRIVLINLQMKVQRALPSSHSFP